MDIKVEEKENVQTVVITGSTQGIGKAVALRFAKERYQVVVNCRNQDKYDQGLALVNECKILSGEDATCIVADVSTSEGCKLLVDAAIEKFGKIDVLVNNAGVMQYALLHRMKEKDYCRVIENNQNSVFYMLKHTVSYMIKRRKGCIVNVASMAGVKGTQCLVAYSASKGAVIAMTKAAAVELSSKNIRVNAVAPGMVETSMTECLSEKQVEKACKEILVNRFASSEEIANAIWWLSSEETEYITGYILEMSGGM